MRCLILLRLDAGVTPACIARELLVARSTISRVRSCFLAEGLMGLRDHRAHNGQRKVYPAHRRRPEPLLDACPRDFGWARPTWTRELLALQLERDTGLRLSVGHIGRLPSASSTTTRSTSRASRIDKRTNTWPLRGKTTAPGLPAEDASRTGRGTGRPVLAVLPARES
ncbi:helix-turn-helix domain-containing protein [Sorangium sp. So ce1099]|uniref:helix-turn-helix domain-containing protein n=1 Tax=Sorangium sp. So ce1099 TaxID=3133331 RepID=UPI003F644520